MKYFFPFTIIGASFIMATSSCNSNDAIAERNVKEQLISDSTMRLLKIDTAQLRNVDDELKLSGEVSFDENKVVKIYPYLSGHVLSTSVSVGDYVRAGQQLATIKSADVAGNYSDLSISGNDVAITKRSMENAEHLYKNGIASEKEFLEAKENYNKAVSNANKIKEQIQINGGGKTTANGIYTVTAPRSGYVVEKLINPGNFIRNDNNGNMFTIGDIQDVWIWASVYETDISKVKQGYTAAVTTVAYPDSVFMGKVDKVSQILDPVTKVMKIKIVLPNTNNTLKPSMFANITISNKEVKKTVAVPATATINDNQKSFVIVFNNSDDAAIREVKILKTSEGFAYIISGLQEGEKVITKNQILIYKKLQDINNNSASKK
jgi:cobalt-zinc-cadmium efflux system membrane fusion protein